MKELKMLNYPAAEKILKEGEGMIDDLKKFWYHN